MRHRIIQIICTTLVLLILRGPAYPWTDGQNAEYVVGQDDFNSNSAGTTNKKLNVPTDVAVDAVHLKFYVVDNRNNRVLRYVYPIAGNNPAADLVFGQPNFTSNSSGTSQNTFDDPRGVTIDGEGRLWVADAGNHRVVWFNNAWAAVLNQPNADGVLGQAGFTSRTSATTQNGMNRPYDAAVDANGRLFVAEIGNNRVLRFDSAADKANGASADRVLGQPGFTSGGSATTQKGMSWPRGLAVYGSALLVADRSNARVLRFDDAASKDNGANADGVLGQPDFTTGRVGCTQSKIGNSGKVTVDGSGRLYVSDAFRNDRIVIFNDAVNKANGANADNVLGQTNFTNQGGALGQNRLNMDSSGGGVSIDSLNNRLFVADFSNNRVMVFKETVPGTPEMNLRKGITYIPDGGT